MSNSVVSELDFSDVDNFDPFQYNQTAGLESHPSSRLLDSSSPFGSSSTNRLSRVHAPVHPSSTNLPSSISTSSNSVYATPPSHGY